MLLHFHESHAERLKAEQLIGVGIALMLMVVPMKRPFHTHGLCKARNRFEAVLMAIRGFVRDQNVGRLAVEVEPVIVIDC